MNKESVLTIAMLTMLTASAANVKAEEADQEKCFGVVKAKMNDCGVKDKHACAGVASKDGDSDEWIFVPKGTCTKLVNGHLTATPAKKKASTKS